MVCPSQCISKSSVFTGTGDPIEEIDLVEFRLLYEGELLPSAGSKKRTSEKHSIRRAFHPQLRRLWSVNSNLRSLANHTWVQSLPDNQYMGALEYMESKGQDSLNAHTLAGLEIIGKKWARAGFNFIPLVTSDMALRCSIDITLLRPEEERLIFEAGDIDGQLKTLFDALRMPANSDESSGVGPQEDENPFYCLLEDDRLISEVKVSTDTMLLLPNTRDVRANEAHAIIHVKLNHKKVNSFGNYF